MRTKQYQKTKEAISSEAISIPEAVALLQKKVDHKFDQTIEVHIHLGVNASKSDQMVRGTVHLPSGSVRTQRVAVFTDDAKIQKAAQAAGAISAGGEDLIKTIIESGSLDADLTIATPDMMRSVSKLGRILGTRGLMPSPKSGTVTFDLKKAIEETKAGRVEFRIDKTSIINSSVGRVSFPENKLVDNIKAFIQAVVQAKPPAAKGKYIKSIHVSSTMGTSLRISESVLEK